jgi:hypothetical protein
MGNSDLKGIPLKNMVGEACKITVVHPETDDGICKYRRLQGTAGADQGPGILLFFSLDPADVPDFSCGVAGVGTDENHRVGNLQGITGDV